MAWAQTLDSLKPKPVPSQVSPPAVPSAPASHHRRSVDVGLLKGEKMLLPSLKGVAFYKSESEARKAKPGAGITIAGVPVLRNDALYHIVDYFADKPVSKQGLDRLANAVRLYLSAAGYPFSLVYIPPQDITAGKVRFVVTISHLEGPVVVQGAKYFSPAQYRAAIQLKQGQPINKKQLEADVAWINRNPFRAATATAVAGSAPATTRILLHVNERKPWRFFTGVDNTGTSTTKRNHLTAGLNWGNAFGRGDLMSLQWNSSWDFNTFISASGSYQMNMPSHRVLIFSGAYSHTNGVVAAPFTLTGKSWQVSADYQIPYTVSDKGTRSSRSLDIGVDVKSSNNNFEFSTIPISNNLTEVVQARIGWSASLVDRKGDSTSFNATLTAAPGNLTGRNKDKYFNVSRAGAKAEYVYIRTGASHRMSLAGIKRGLAWSVRGSVQLANHNLIGSEQFQGGGMNAVRGYEENQAYGDNGVLLSQELHLPPWRSSRGFFQAYLFEDYAHLWSTHKLPGEQSVNLSSIGVGLDYALGRYVSVRAAYGYQLINLPASSSGRHSRFDLTAQFSY